MAPTFGGCPSRAVWMMMMMMCVALLLLDFLSLQYASTSHTHHSALPCASITSAAPLQPQHEEAHPLAVLADATAPPGFSFLLTSHTTPPNPPIQTHMHHCHHEHTARGKQRRMSDTGGFNPFAPRVSASVERGLPPLFSLPPEVKKCALRLPPFPTTCTSGLPTNS